MSAIVRNWNRHLEHLTKPKSDESGGKGHQGQMDIGPALIANEQTLVSMKPGNGALDNPTVFSQVRGTLNPSPGNPVFDIPGCTGLPAKGKVISFICVKFLRMARWFSVQIPQRRYMFQHGSKHFAVVNIGSCKANSKRNTISIRYNMMLASRATSIYRVGSCKFAPLFAWIKELSIHALVQSSFFA